MNEQESLATWAVVEIMGHQVTAGFIRTRYFGGVCMFHIEASAVDGEPIALDHGQYIGGAWIPTGSIVKVHREAVNRMLSLGSVFSITPCDEDTARARQPRRLEIVELAESHRLEPEHTGNGLDDEEEPEDDADAAEFETRVDRAFGLGAVGGDHTP